MAGSSVASPDPPGWSCSDSRKAGRQAGGNHVERQHASRVCICVWFAQRTTSLWCLPAMSIAACGMRCGRPPGVAADNGFRGLRALGLHLAVHVQRHKIVIRGLTEQSGSRVVDVCDDGRLTTETWSITQEWSVCMCSG